MCIAILNVKGTLKTEQIKNSWDNNNEGAGLLWREQGKLQTFKSYSYKEFLNKYLTLRDNKNITKIVLHFRIATSGHDKYVNLHPFLVNDNLGFVHNGVIYGLGNKERSDTFQFNEMLKGLPTGFLHNETIVKFIENYIGYSKLVFLDNKNNHYIINESLGHYDNIGNWYSNDSYKQNNDFVYFGNQKVSKGKTETKAQKKQAKKYSKKWDLFEQEEALNNLFYYSNATIDNLKILAELLGLEYNTEEFYDEVNALSYDYNTYDIREMIEWIEMEYEGININEDDNDCDLYWTNQGLKNY